MRQLCGTFMRLLVADDDAMNVALLEVVLQDFGHEVVVARDGEEAWEVMQADEAPPLAILDWVMPGLQGTEICRKLRQQRTRPYPYLIMLTSKDDMDDLVEGIDAGADDFLRKPFDPRELRARVIAGERMLALQHELRTRATLDELTGLLNRATILERLQRQVDRDMRSGGVSSIVLIDLDNFKRINDSHGHRVGDEVLLQATTSLTGSVRSCDELGRYGGEEFLAVLPGCDLRSALYVAERMRTTLSTALCATSAGPVQVSASFGVASTEQFGHLATAELLNHADAALYRAKRAGRNRVEGSIPPAAIRMQ
jgi:two-component system cell cycle response regulator